MVLIDNISLKKRKQFGKEEGEFIGRFFKKKMHRYRIEPKKAQITKKNIRLSAMLQVAK